MNEDIKLLEQFPENVYMVPESHLFRLLGICAKKNGCKNFGDTNCQCSNANFVPKKRGRPARETNE
ncbi:MAG: hypothetical protein PHG08_00450 [Bacilli bacterium]|nr:hypothetical protein [Bacilli bacterium]